MLNVVMLNVANDASILSVIMLNVAFMLSVTMLSVIMLSVVAPFFSPPTPTPTKKFEMEDGPKKTWICNFFKFLNFYLLFFFFNFPSKPTKS